MVTSGLWRSLRRCTSPFFGPAGPLTAPSVTSPSQGGGGSAHGGGAGGAPLLAINGQGMLRGATATSFAVAARCATLARKCGWAARRISAVKKDRCRAPGVDRGESLGHRADLGTAGDRQTTKCLRVVSSLQEFSRTGARHSRRESDCILGEEVARSPELSSPLIIRSIICMRVSLNIDDSII